MLSGKLRQCGTSISRCQQNLAFRRITNVALVTSKRRSMSRNEGRGQQMHLRHLDDAKFTCLYPLLTLLHLISRMDEVASTHRSGVPARGCQ